MGSLGGTREARGTSSATGEVEHEYTVYRTTITLSSTVFSNMRIYLLAVLVFCLLIKLDAIAVSNDDEAAGDVHMLVPGFTVEKLPIELTNLNNLRYRHDGVLVALGYNGNIWLLRDTDGDGREDSATLYWDNKGRLRGPIGMVVTPPGYSHGSGVIVASKGKLSMLADTDGDDVADEEKIIANGWKEIPQNVDAVGVALAPNGTLYFALGCANYANGYLVNKQGVSEFDLASERGTIQKVSPDWSKRETVCTGIRFPVSMDWTDENQLITSEQEGATWLPNGNPFDELLHIVEGKHYGFPPRHPKHLPNVVNEPAVFDYAPQHQSTCGIFFNRSVCGGPTFGPSDWAGNVLVCGQSRGQIFRTELLPSEQGYVARNQTIARLNKLTIDCTVAPDGSLLIATHSGPPDWGTGPEGAGTIYKIRYADNRAAQPTQIFAMGPTEICIAFDRSLEADTLRRINKQVEMIGGPYVEAGDTYTTLVPPYEAVRAQIKAAREKVEVLSVATSPDLRNILITTAPRRPDWQYGVRLPSTQRAEDYKTVPPIDLALDSSGVYARLTSKNGADYKTVSEMVLPHLDLNLARRLTKGSSLHDAFWNALQSADRLQLQTRFDASHCLEPPVQPGSTLDYEPETEQIDLVVQSDRLLTSTSPNAVLNHFNDAWTSVASHRSDEATPFSVECDLGSSKELHLNAYYRPIADKLARAIPLRRFRLDKADPTRKFFDVHSADNLAHTSNDNPIPKSKQFELPRFRSVDANFGKDASPSWLRGRNLFYSEKAACFKCHSMTTGGSGIGPSLANSPSREIEALVRDIINPSAMINPDHLGYICLTKDGKTITGTLLEQSEKQIVLGALTGDRVTVLAANMEELKLSKLSAMPADYANRLTSQEMMDIIAFLITKPFSPASFVRKDVAPARTNLEWESFYQTTAKPDSESTTDPKPFRIALFSGPKDHGPDEHDYPLFQKRWSYLLSLDNRVEVNVFETWPEESFYTGNQRPDLMLFNSANPGWDASRTKLLDEYLASGGGLVFVHFALNGRNAPEALAQRIGLACDVPKVRYRHGPLNLKWQQPNHPILHGLPELNLEDESYWNLTGNRDQLQVLATQDEDGKAHPQIWTVEHGRGRVFSTIVGHYSWSFDDPLYRALLLRGIAWAANREIDTLLPLSTVGARLEELINPDGEPVTRLER